MQLSVGTVLKGGEYRIDGKLGQGGFGITYRATQTALGRTVAIKEFFIESMNVRGSDGRSVEVAVAACRSDYDSQRDKFRREARRLSAFDNQHIVRVLDLFDENDTSYYVMEYLEGESLDRRSRRVGRMSEAEVMGVVDDVLDALATMHAVSLWHLDLKPGNLIRTPAGLVKVIDFGASKMVAGGRVTLLSSTTSLTPGYAPLEQMGGAVTQFGPWTDLYALGATAYVLLSGEERPPLPSELLGGMGALQWPADVSAETRALVEWMLQPSPQARPQSVADVRGRKGTSRQPNDDSGGSTRTFTVNGVQFTMVRVKGGTFTMGATAEQGSDVWDDEKPAHRVTLSDYWIG